MDIEWESENTVTRIKGVLRYDKETKGLRWINDGRIFSCDHGNGYRCGMLFGTKMYEHRLVFLMEHGYLPNEIDHIDRDKANNDINNLRDATRAENLRNTLSRSATGAKYVYRRDNGAYRAQVYYEGAKYDLGTYWEIEDAIKTVEKKCKELGITYTTYRA
jgi:hypothetical protein